MSTVSITTFMAMLMFAGFHVPLPQRQNGKWSMTFANKAPARLMGIAYHLLMLPAVSVLPAPVWGIAAGYGWMLLDAVLDTADLAGTKVDVAPFREGTHVVAAVWLVSAGWSNGVLLAIIGTLHAAAFLYRLGIASGARFPAPTWFRHLGALLNIAWMIAVAVALI